MLKSSTAKSLYSILGMTEQIKEFDKNHSLFKTTRLEKYGQKCINMKSLLSKQVKSVLESSEKLFKEWEKSFFLKNGREPKIPDVVGDQQKLFQKITQCRNLIKKWKV